MNLRGLLWRVKRTWQQYQSKASNQDLLNNLAVNIGQAEVTAAIAIREPFVVESEKMESRGMQIMHVRAFLDRFEPELVRGAVGHTTLDAAARQ